MKTVKHLLKAKGQAVWTVAPQASVYDALRIMSEKNVGAVVVQREGKLAGIFTERDYARKVILQGRYSKDLTVQEVMTSAVITVTQQQTIAECLALMTRHHIRHLPVVEDGRLAGIISMRDVMDSIIAEQENTIERLESYMLGTEPGV